MNQERMEEELILNAEKTAKEAMRGTKTNDCDASAYLAEDGSLCIDCRISIMNGLYDSTEHEFFVSVESRNGTFHAEDVYSAVLEAKTKCDK